MHIGERYDINLYIRNLKYAHITPAFDCTFTIYIYNSLPTHTNLCTDKQVLNASFQDF